MVRHSGFTILFKDGSISKIEYKRSYDTGNILKHVARYIKRNGIDLEDIEKIDLAKYNIYHR